MPDFRRLFLGNLASQISIWTQQLVFSWLLLTLGGSPFWLGLGGLLNGVAMMFSAPICGALADAFDRRRLMYVTQVAMVIVNGGALALLLLNRLTVWHLLIGVICMGVLFSLNMPARQAWTFEIVGKRLMQNATALHGLLLNTTRVVGPLLAGVLLGTIGAPHAMAFCLLANIWSLYLLTCITHRSDRPRARFTLRVGELLEGVTYCFHHPELRLVFGAIAISNFFGAAIIQLLPSLARDVLDVGPEGLGALSAGLGGGAIMTAVVIARRTAVRRKSLTLLVGGVVLGVVLVGVGQSRSMPLTLLLLVLAGVCSSLAFSVGVTSLGELVPDQLAGRAMAIYTLTLGLTPIGSFPAGAAATAIGTGHAISLYGLICAGLNLVLLFVSRRSGGAPARPAHATSPESPAQPAALARDSVRE
jgi:MFS family permease